MRDLVAAILAIVLLLVAASLGTTLNVYRRRRQRTRDAEQAHGRRIIAEVPTPTDLVLFSEDRERFYYGEQVLDKELITAVTMTINGVPLATAVSRRPADEPVPSRGPNVERDGIRPPLPGGEASVSVEHEPDGIARDRWDVSIEMPTGRVLIECGAIRERVSQELARAIFDAVKLACDRRAS